VAQHVYIPPEVEAICEEVYEAIAERNHSKVHELNIKLLRTRARPALWQRADATIQNLQEQIRDLADVEQGAV